MTKNNFKNYALIIIATAILTLVSMLPLGILGIVVSALLASTIGYTITKHHYFFVGAVCVFVLLMYSIFSKDFYTSIVVWLPITLCGITLGISYNIKASEFVTSGVICGIYTVYILLNIKLLGQDISELLSDIFSESIKNYSDIMAGTYPEQFSTTEIQTLLGDAMSVMMKFMPAFMIIVCGILALLMLYVFKKVLKLTKSDTSFFKPFYTWHADKSFSIVFLLIALISLFLPQRNYIADALSNVVLVSIFVFYIFGLALVDFLLDKKFKNKLSRRAVLLLLVAFSSGVPMLIFCFAGALDGIVDIRGKIKKPNLPKEE